MLMFHRYWVTLEPNLFRTRRVSRRSCTIIKTTVKALRHDMSVAKVVGKATLIYVYMLPPVAACCQYVATTEGCSQCRSTLDCAWVSICPLLNRAICAL